MARVFIALGLALCLCLPLASAAVNPGANRFIDVEGTPIESITVPEVSTDGVDFTIAVVLNENASANGTTVQWTVQQCINSGVCFQPEVLNMSVEDGTWTYTLMPVETHAYVNFDIVLTYPEGEDEKFPESGFVDGGKIWSDCWVSGEDTGGANCPVEEVDDDSLLAPGLLAGAAVTLLAAMMARRED